jgi:ubiquitin-protein ligase
MYNISSTSISNYFNIKDKNLTINLVPNNKKFLLSFNYTKKIKFIQFNNLPDDLHHVIYSFLNPNYIHVIYEMNVSNDYPFNPPTWSLYSIDYKCNHENINIQEYYNYLIQNHNNESERQWSPAIKFEQEFLRLIVRLNHFHYLFQ